MVALTLLLALTALAPTSAQSVSDQEAYAIAKDAYPMMLIGSELHSMV